MIINYFLPKKTLNNTELKRLFPAWDENVFANKVGIKNRHIVSKGETALNLAFEASKLALKGFDKNTIDFLILCTQSPDYKLPTSACILQDMLKLPTSCGAFDYNLGCSGYVYGITIAKGLLSSGAANNILLVMSETYTKYIHDDDKTNRSIFGDGAAATIITSKDLNKIGYSVLCTDGSGYDKLIVKNGGSKFQHNDKAKIKEYGTHNKYDDNHLYMDGPDIFTFTINNVPKLIDKTLDKNKLKRDDIDFFVFHQANEFMLNFLRKKSKIPLEKFIIDIAETANTVSATIPIALTNAINNNVIKPGDKVLIAGFGVGLSWGATIITI